MISQVLNAEIDREGDEPGVEEGNPQADSLLKRLASFFERSRVDAPEKKKHAGRFSSAYKGSRSCFQGFRSSISLGSP